MSKLRKQFEITTDKTFEFGKKEYLNLVKFYNQNKIDDFELSCDINFYKNGKEVTYFYCLFLKDRLKENNPEELLESMESWCLSQIPPQEEVTSFDNAVIRITSYYQLLKKPKANLDLNEQLAELEFKLFGLREELQQIYSQELHHYFFSLDTWLIIVSNEGEEDELSFPSIEFKFPTLRRLRSYEDYKFSLSCKPSFHLYSNLVREFKRLREAYGENKINSRNIKEIWASIKVSRDYLLFFENSPKLNLKVL